MEGDGLNDTAETDVVAEALLIMTARAGSWTLDAATLDAGRCCGCGGDDDVLLLRADGTLLLTMLSHCL